MTVFWTFLNRIGVFKAMATSNRTFRSSPEIRCRAFVSSAACAQTGQCHGARSFLGACQDQWFFRAPMWSDVEGPKVIASTGCVWKCCVPQSTQWFCWSLSLLNGYFIGDIPYFQTHHENPTALTHSSVTSCRVRSKLSTSKRGKRWICWIPKAQNNGKAMHDDALLFCHGFSSKLGHTSMAEWRSSCSAIFKSFMFLLGCDGRCFPLFSMSVSNSFKHFFPHVFSHGVCLRGPFAHACSLPKSTAAQLVHKSPGLRHPSRKNHWKLLGMVWFGDGHPPHLEYLLHQIRCPRFRSWELLDFGDLAWDQWKSMTKAPDPLGLHVPDWRIEIETSWQGAVGSSVTRLQLSLPKFHHLNPEIPIFWIWTVQIELYGCKWKPSGCRSFWKFWVPVFQHTSGAPNMARKNRIRDKAQIDQLVSMAEKFFSTSQLVSMVLMRELKFQSLQKKIELKLSFNCHFPLHMTYDLLILPRQKFTSNRFGSVDSADIVWPPSFGQRCPIGADDHPKTQIITTQIIIWQWVKTCQTPVPSCAPFLFTSK